MSSSTQILDLIEVGQAGKEITANDFFSAASPAVLFARRQAASIGLTWAYYGGWYADQEIENGSFVLPASSTSYIEVDTAGVVSQNIVGFTVGALALYSVVTSSTAVTSYIDRRQIGGGGGSSELAVAAMDAADAAQATADAALAAASTAQTTADSAGDVADLAIIDAAAALDAAYAAGGGVGGTAHNFIRDTSFIIDPPILTGGSLHYSDPISLPKSLTGAASIVRVELLTVSTTPHATAAATLMKHQSFIQLFRVSCDADGLVTLVSSSSAAQLQTTDTTGISMSSSLVIGPVGDALAGRIRLRLSISSSTSTTTLSTYGIKVSIRFTIVSTDF